MPSSSWGWYTAPASDTSHHLSPPTVPGFTEPPSSAEDHLAAPGARCSELSHLILWGSSDASMWDACGTYGTHTCGPKVSVLGGRVTKFPSLPSLGWIDLSHFYMVPQVVPLAGSPSCPQWQPTGQHTLVLALLPPCFPLPSSPLLFFKITSQNELPACKLRLRAPLSGNTQAKPAS